MLLNFARDAIVDEDAVIAALRAQKLRAYITDFPSAKLIGEPGVVALPHLGASTAEAEDNSAVMVVDQVREFLEQGTIANSVNFPQRRDGARVAAPRRDRQRERPQHARPDQLDDGEAPASTSTTW